MICETVDPRGITWEVTRPVYRIYFWHQHREEGDPGARVGLAGTEFRIREATDIEEVLAWAQETARPDETFTAYVEHDSETGTGLIQLVGHDPHSPPRWSVHAQ